MMHGVFLGHRVNFLLFAAALLCVPALSGCALWAPKEAPETEDKALARAAENEALNLKGEPLPYTVRIEVEGLEDSAAQSELIAAMRGGSQLVKMHDEPPDSRVGLELRTIADREAAKTMLDSLGYYEGSAASAIDWTAKPVEVRLILNPGKRFVVGRATLETLRKAGLPERAQSRLARAPQNLKPFGVADGAPAVADAISSAVAAVPDWYKNQGFPYARVQQARYRLYPVRRELNPLVQVAPGPFARFGEIAVSGAETVDPEFLKRLAPWRENGTWRARQLDAYRDTLLQSGLFREVTVRANPGGRLPAADKNPEAAAGAGAVASASDVSATPASGPAGAAPASGPDAAPTGGPGAVPLVDARRAPRRFVIPDAFPDDKLPVLVQVREGPQRRTGVGLKFDTDQGVDVRGFWEHRNLFGAGENLRLTGEVAQYRQELISSFKKPAFLQKNQNLVSDAYIRNEETDAYDLTGGYADLGLERKLSRRWWASLRASGQSGRIREDGYGWTSYSIFGVPFTARWEGTNSLLNPTEGARFQLSAIPYSGSYRGAFSLLRLQGTFSAYYAPLKDKDGEKSDRLVLAARASAGGMAGSMGDKVEKIPGSLRFYAGGGGSVRGYKYQTLGPRNSKGDPLGGLSFTSFNVEARYKLTKNIGVVPFVDVGGIYDKPVPDFGRDLYWAAGLGVRYYTAIGPIRLDVAVPFKDRSNQKAFQMYISIGQAF